MCVWGGRAAQNMSLESIWPFSVQRASDPYPLPTHDVLFNASQPDLFAETECGSS